MPESTNSLWKSAAQMVRRPRVRTEYDDHCPHCDHRFTEKGYPRPDFSKLPEDPEERQRMILEGECDDICPACGGIVDSPDTPDEEIEALRKSWGDKAADKVIETQTRRRERREAREKQADFKEDLAEARKTTDTRPTPAQIAAGNYRKGKVTLRDLTISIENPRGSVRRGKDRQGKTWETKMKHDYGYILRTEAVDGDHVDVFLGPDPEHGRIWVVDQYVGGKYDEPKVMLGFESEEAAREGYLANYDKNWKGLHRITEMAEDQFKAWLEDGAPETGQKKEARPLMTAMLPSKQANRALLSIATRLTPKSLKTTLNLGGKTMGQLQATTRRMPSIGPARSIEEAWVKNAIRGQGYGRKEYGNAIREAYKSFQQGGPRWITSDHRRVTSHVADDLWNALKRRGYPVVRNPAAQYSPLRWLVDIPYKNPRYGIDLRRMGQFYKDKPPLINR